MKAGIEDLEIATTHYKVGLDTLANALGIDPAKYRFGLRQLQFSMPALDEDIVTLGASAASRLIERTGLEGVRTLIVSTESSVDQSKSAAVFMHSLLGLPETVRAFETKQACYAGTAALQMALGIVARNTDERVLVVMSDIARYQVDTPGEPTQGAGAVAVMVSANPTLFEVDPATGVWTQDINDFWRPNDMSWPLVDGVLSMNTYFDAFKGAWTDYQAHGGVELEDIDLFVHHQPFTKMAVKAHHYMSEFTGVTLADEQVEPSLAYTPRIGNSYTASLFMGLASVLHDPDTKPGMRVGLMSYGSGAVGEFFSGVVSEGFADQVNPTATVAELDAREDLSFEAYRELHAAHQRGSDVDFGNPKQTAAPFRFAGVKDGARYYEKNS